MTQAIAKNKMSLLMLTASVAGNMMGSGLFLLPATLAGIGSISLFGWFLSIFGASALALVFAKLAVFVPKAGGPYAFTRHSYGSYLSFQTAFVYWIGAWIGNIAVAIVLVGYLAFFFPALHHPLTACLLGIVFVWLFIGLNMFGPRFMGRLQIVTTITMLVPVLFTAIAGWFWFDKNLFLNAFRVNDISVFDAVSRSAAMTLWAFVGVETATVNAGVVENPEKTIPLATLFGVALAGIIYILSSSVIMGIVPQNTLAASSSPFSLFAAYVLGPSAGTFVSICAVIACAGTLSGWTLVMGQIAKAAADDNLFPKIFGLINRHNSPYFGLICSGILISILYFLTLSATIGAHFTIISETAVFMMVLSYLYSCLSLFILTRTNTVTKNDLRLYIPAACVGVLYSFWAIIGLGEKIVFFGALTILFTAVLYIYPVLKKQY